MGVKIFSEKGTTNLILPGICIALGLILATNPEAITSIISIILGALLILLGIIKLFGYNSTNKTDGSLFTTAILCIVSGIVVMFFTHIILEFLRILIGTWIIYAGIMGLIKVIKWREYTSKLWIVSLILSVILFGIGLFVLINSNAIVQTLGIVIVIYGIIDVIANIIFMKKAN